METTVEEAVAVDKPATGGMKTVQVTLDPELVEAVDRAVSKLGTSRSGFTREALRRSLARLERKEFERRHQEGYAKHPVEPGEFDVGTITAMAHQLTIRYDDDVAQEIEDLARRKGLSRNQVVLLLIRRGAGIGEDAQDQDVDVIGSSLDWFVGSWSEEQAREFDEAGAAFKEIDEVLWK